MGLLGNVRFRWAVWEAFWGERCWIGRRAAGAEGPTGGRGGAEQGMGGLEAGRSQARDERKPGGIASEQGGGGQ